MRRFSFPIPRRLSGRVAACSLTLLAALALPAGAREPALVRVPLQFDYSLLHKLLVSQLFGGPGGSYDLVNDPAGCNRIELTNPEISPRGEALRVLAQVDANLGMSVFGACRGVFAWQGRAGFLGVPILAAGGDAVRLEPRDAWLTLDDGSRIAASRLPPGVLDRLSAYFARYRLDLSSNIDTLAALLPEVLPRQRAEQIDSVMQSLQLGDVRVTPQSLDLTLQFSVPQFDPADSAQVEALSEEELSRWESRWQMMDDLLVAAIKRYAGSTELQAMRDTLLDILLESRYRLRDALAASPARGSDVVRSWFLQSWQRLAPAVRAIATEQPGQQHLLWLGMLSAADALRALDRLGPGVGLDISTDGLRRLARLISAGEVPLLEYDTGADPELQRLFRLGPPAVTTPPSTSWNLRLTLFPRAHAALPVERLNSWAPGRDELGIYLPLVADLLNQSAREVLADASLDATYASLYMKAVWATAWQESCWRQYTVEERKLVPLRSGTGDVGLMQINERVWRGFFDRQELRWNIQYNATAGARILKDYLVKYALRRGEHKQPGGLQNLARASYSAYNGGPSQVARYRNPDPAPYHRKVDTAFWDKYRQIEAGSARGVSRCLGGNVPLAVPAQAAAGTGERQPGPAASINAGRAWQQAQPAGHYTLQLGAFSSAEAATRFLAAPEVPETARLHALRNADSTAYLVLQGSYPDRAAAEAAKAALAQPDAWARQIDSLRATGTP